MAWEDLWRRMDDWVDGVLEALAHPNWYVRVRGSEEQVATVWIRDSIWAGPFGPCHTCADIVPGPEPGGPQAMTA
ncbi:hypothetical protein [Nocardia mexicana]|uniref:Uncharacterized protein n=1 Tax=Nocardia mexicana TaxID=279262 RepID=A0A370GV71_9NOCA|nr:hypothetical protein [Nocardia mexicana]RDI46474.1 hypothetical protein DFR68_111233 [Nocardia mexicana]